MIATPFVTCTTAEISASSRPGILDVHMNRETARRRDGVSTIGGSGT
jgi:hypothetical protein